MEGDTDCEDGCSIRDLTGAQYKLWEHREAGTLTADMVYEAARGSPQNEASGRHRLPTQVSAQAMATGTTSPPASHGR